MSQTRMEFAYTQLRDKVWSGELTPGTRLVNRSLGEELGVSTITVREAIHRLAVEGLVKHVPNAGAFVRTMNRKEMIDLLVLRSNIDCFVIEQSTRRIVDHQVRLLEVICGQWREMVDGMRNTSDRRLTGALLAKWLEMDSRLHGVLVEAAGNSWLTEIVNGIDLNTRAMRSVSRPI